MYSPCSPFSKSIGTTGRGIGPCYEDKVSRKGIRFLDLQNVDIFQKKLKVYFTNGYFESTDEGDITIKNSYNDFNYSQDIQSVDGIRNTDLIDIRPRVSNYSVSESDRSPLEFFGRSFDIMSSRFELLVLTSIL